MAIINVPVGGQARSVHIQQVINWLRGVPASSEPVSLTGITNAEEYAATIGNSGTGGLALSVLNSAQTIRLLDVKDSGVSVRGHDIAATYFRVRNFANSADLFSVTEAGANIGGSTVVTTTGTQTMTNKTLTAANLADSIVTTFLDVLNQSTPATPTAGRIRIFEASDSLRFVDSTGTVKQFATLTGTETFTNKTLTDPSVTQPAITGYVDLLSAAAPGSPSANRLRLYNITGENLIKFKNSAGTVRELVDLDSVQTLSNKTISLTALTATTLNNPVVSNYIEMDWASSPGGAASKSRLWAKNDNNLYYTLPGGTIITILTNLTAPSFSSLSLARPLMFVGGY